MTSAFPSAPALEQNSERLCRRVRVESLGAVLINKNEILSVLHIGLFSALLLCRGVFCSADEASGFAAETQVSVSQDSHKDELNQTQQQPLGCTAAGCVLQGFGVCVSSWSPSCWMIEVPYLSRVAPVRLQVCVRTYVCVCVFVYLNEAKEITFSIK